MRQTFEELLAKIYNESDESCEWGSSLRQSYTNIQKAQSEVINAYSDGKLRYDEYCALYKLTAIIKERIKRGNNNG